MSYTWGEVPRDPIADDEEIEAFWAEYMRREGMEFTVQTEKPAHFWRNFTCIAVFLILACFAVLYFMPRLPQ